MDFLCNCSIKNGHYRVFFCLIALLITALIGLYHKPPLLAYTKNGLFCFITLSKIAFMTFFENRFFFNEPLSKWPFMLYHFIKNGPLLTFISSNQKWPFKGFFALSKTAFICLYQKQSFSLYRFAALSKTAFIGLYLNCLY